MAVFRHMNKNNNFVLMWNHKSKLWLHLKRGIICFTILQGVLGMLLKHVSWHWQGKYHFYHHRIIWSKKDRLKENNHLWNNVDCLFQYYVKIWCYLLLMVLCLLCVPHRIKQKTWNPELSQVNWIPTSIMEHTPVTPDVLTASLQWRDISFKCCQDHT